jgi:hypothetical protein
LNDTYHLDVAEAQAEARAQVICREQTAEVPAGGIGVENAADVAAFYGPESMLLIGGDL